MRNQTKYCIQRSNICMAFRIRCNEEKHLVTKKIDLEGLCGRELREQKLMGELTNIIFFCIENIDNIFSTNSFVKIEHK